VRFLNAFFYVGYTIGLLECRYKYVDGQIRNSIGCRPINCGGGFIPLKIKYWFNLILQSRFIRWKYFPINVEHLNK
jgi:hypothetical protein